MQQIAQRFKRDGIFRQQRTRVLGWTFLALFTLASTCGRAQEEILPSKTETPAGTSISLAELQRTASEMAMEVLMARQELQAASLELSAFESSLRPRLDLVANLPNYYRTSTEVTQDDGTVAFREIELNNSFVGLFATQRLAGTGGVLRLESRLQRTDNFAQNNKGYNGSPLRLSFLQPLLAFNPWKWDRRLLPLQREVSERELAAAKAAAALEATFRFFDLIDADQERRIAETNKRANEQLFTVAEERYALGKINRGDLVQLRLELASAEQNLLRAERLVAAASAAIYQLLGRPYAQELLRPELPDAQVETDIEAATAMALMNARRPELLAVRQRSLEAEREVDRVKRDLGPRIDIEAGFGFIRNDQELAPIYTDPRDERIVSVNLNLPILDWGQRKALTQRAASAEALTREIARRTEQDLNSELLQLLEQWRTVQEELRLATAIRDLAQERFEISQESYTLGAIPLAELTLAQQFRDQNTRAYAATLRAYWLTYARLARLTLWDFINNAPLGE